MDRREQLLGLAQMMRERGEPIPLDMLAEADELGLSLTEFDQPSAPNPLKHEGE